ncbi:hypothetical protein QYF61_005646 [Mycteria americana]|uniref:Uncharacterized protein n=1 Tax=Mycteria americana TaxID=33587 RepID=A0AAN7NXL0_MYCAM|nr:hypothetical protein QYF61_005646 [Mycteria americana]
MFGWAQATRGGPQEGCNAAGQLLAVPHQALLHVLHVLYVLGDTSVSELTVLTLGELLVLLPPSAGSGSQHTASGFLLCPRAGKVTGTQQELRRISTSCSTASVLAQIVIAFMGKLLGSIWEAKQPQFPQPLLIRLLLQTLHQLRCPSLDTLQHLNVPLVVRGPKLNTVFQPLFPKPVVLHGVAVAQGQDLALGLVKPHTIDLGPSIQPVQVPLQSLPTLKQINTPTQLGVICKLTEDIDKDIKQNWPQHRALGNTACDRPPTGVNSIHHHSLGPAIQPVLYPAKSTPVQAMGSQFLQENAVGNRVKGFTEVQIDNIHSLSLIH